MASLEEVLSTALALGLENRAALVARLLDSLEELTEEEESHLWAKAATRRLVRPSPKRYRCCVV